MKCTLSASPPWNAAKDQVECAMKPTGHTISGQRRQPGIKHQSLGWTHLRRMMERGKRRNCRMKSGRRKRTFSGARGAGREVSRRCSPSSSVTCTQVGERAFQLQTGKRRDEDWLQDSKVFAKPPALPSLQGARPVAYDYFHTIWCVCSHR